MRTLLEALNARLAARRHDPEIVALLQDTLGAATRRRSRASPEQLARLNAEFHERLAEASRNSVLSDIMRACASAPASPSPSTAAAARARTGRSMPASWPP